MEFYLTRTLNNISVEEAEVLATKKLKEQGFGVVTRIDMAATLKTKLGVDFRPYVILGACNPGFAHKALTRNDKVGVMLPCNVCLQKVGDGVEVFAVNPLVAMEAVASSEIDLLGQEVAERLQNMLDGL